MPDRPSRLVASTLQSNYDPSAMPVPNLPDVQPLLVRYIESWVERLAAGDWDGAMSLIDTPNHYGIRWSTVNVRRILVDYGRGIEPKVTAPRDRQGVAARFSVVALDDGSGYFVAYDLPLDGADSDLTAQFEFLLSGDEYVVALLDLHVL
jgi:hypothetical protein